MKFIKSLYINQQFYGYLALISVCFLLSFWVTALYNIAWLLLFSLCILLLVDIILLYRFTNSIIAHRILPEKLSNSDQNTITISIVNHYPFKVYIEVIDELPILFQKRDFLYTTTLSKGQKQIYNYQVRPVERGKYTFGKVNVYAATLLKIIKRKYVFNNQQMVAVYPSFIQMQQYNFLAISNKLTDFGFKKIRRIGNTQEFEQIKEYTKGNDIRTINWKATAKKNQLMVNQYQEEKSQPIYAIINTGRVMKMPFNQLKLLDYAINTTLAFSNVALKKKDKVGLITFSKKVEAFLPASQKITYLNRIMQELYHINTQYNDSDFGFLYTHLKRKINHRSLLLLFTNFEHISALKRQLPYLKGIAKKHLLVVVLFKNTELYKLTNTKTNSLQDIYHKTIAEKFILEKNLMVKELQKNGIQVLLTAPHKLTINTINKYLEIKAKGIL